MTYLYRARESALVRNAPGVCRLPPFATLKRLLSHTQNLVVLIHSKLKLSVQKSIRMRCCRADRSTVSSRHAFSRL